MWEMLRFFLPVLFIIFGFYVQRSPDPRWNSSRKMGKMLVILGVITLIGLIVLSYLKGDFG